MNNKCNRYVMFLLCNFAYTDCNRAEVAGETRYAANTLDTCIMQLAGNTKVQQQQQQPPQLHIDIFDQILL